MCIRNRSFGDVSLNKALLYALAYSCSWPVIDALEFSSRTHPANPLSSDSDQSNAGSSLPGDSLPQLYAGITNTGVQAISLGNSSVTKVIDDLEFEKGFAFDSIRNKLYYSTWASIYRANLDGSDTVMVYENITQFAYFGSIQGLAVDWITGNLYGTTRWGFVFVCGETPEGLLACLNLLVRGAILAAIAVNPFEGMVYWTGVGTGASFGNSIWRAEMDGSNLAIIVRGVYESIGCLAIDYSQSRLYWTEVREQRIRSSDLAGGDVTTIIDFAAMHANFGPFGIALHEERIYWGHFHGNGMIQSSTKTGQDISTVYNSSDSNYYLAFKPTELLPSNRANDCENHISACPGICVLTPSGSRCLLEEFQQDKDSLRYVYPERYHLY